MTFPTKETMIPFGEAQAAIIAVSEAFSKAIVDGIKDEELRMSILAAAAGNAFDAMFRRGEGKRAGDEQASAEADVLFAKLLGINDA